MMRLNEQIENEMNEFVSISNKLFSNNNKSKCEKVIQNLNDITPFINDKEGKEKKNNTER